jgi:Spy/CpxP family protein refolding chaperone
MRKSSLIKSVLFIGMVLIAMNQTLTAQRVLKQNPEMDERGPKGPRFSHNIPNLTEEQEMKIKELKTVHMKAMLKFKSELEEKKARLKSLETADEVDMDKIYKTIEDIGAIETKMRKERADLHQKIRALLDDEQKVFFDTQYLSRKMSHHRADGRHHGQAFEKK